MRCWSTSIASMATLSAISSKPESARRTSIGSAIASASHRGQLALGRDIAGLRALWPFVGGPVELT